MSDSTSFQIENFDLNRNYCIEASAGTGKTYNIRKIVAKLIEAGVPLSKILLVTYTEKAAGELRDRIRSEIEELVSRKDESAEKRSFAEKALAEIDGATIGTIHSFCQKTLRDFAYESNMPFALSMADEGMVESIVDRKIRDEWADELGEKSVEDFRAMLVNAVKAYKEGVSFAEPITTFENWIPANPEFERNWKILQKYSGEKYMAFKSKNATSAKGFEVSQLMDSIREGKSNKFTNCGTKFDSASPAELNDALEYFFANREKKIVELDSAEDAEKWKFVYEKVQEVYEAFQTRKLENRQISFDDMIGKVRQAVSENSPLCRKLRETYTYAIIDEFQDTNRDQWEIFKNVFLNGSENHIVVVGDPKQSIYSFQGADLDVYREACKEIVEKNGVCGVLDTNFRSTTEMVEFCGALFDGDFFKGENAIPFKASKSSGKVKPATLNGNVIEKPVFLAQDADEESFAKYAVSKIVEFTKSDGGKTALQWFDKDKKEYCDLKLSDIAILARTRSEMDTIEKEMAMAGIPFVRYKDSNLFKGREGKQWIVLLKALDAPDFSGKNRGLLNAALVTDFFRFSPRDVESGDFENPTNAVIRHFAKWRSLLEKFRYAELQERIYADTQIDRFLCEASKLQESAKVRQIGAYIFDYLYNNRVSLEEVVKHLEGLFLSKEDADDEDGNLVSKGSDFDAVQVMTIHASKGLQFPVVISVAGFKELSLKNNFSESAKNPIFANSRDGKKYLGFDALSKKRRKAESLDEWRRLFYVDFTRAESVLILPYYKEKWESKNGKEQFGFLQTSLSLKNSEPSESPKTIDSFVCGESVKESVENAAPACKYVRPKMKISQDASDAPIRDLNGKIFAKSVFQHSYSSLSRENFEKEESEDVSVEGENRNCDGESGFADSAVKALSVDPNPVRIFESSAERISENIVPGVRDYPRGSKLGNALHQTFELMDFQKVGDWENSETAFRDGDLKKCVREQFRSQGFDIERHPDWEEQSISYVWNTMHARLPEIHGGKKTGKFFSLREILPKNRCAEMEFRMNVEGFGENALQNFCKGFVDLLFERNGRYSILDWKSDVLENYGVGGSDGGECSGGTTAKVDEEYAVQRVLYSYCLIQWLKSFGTFGETESEIFENHFGGVYYVFFRGCRAGESSGLYAQTWENYAELKKSFDSILKKRNIAKNSSEEQNDK